MSSKDKDRQTNPKDIIKRGVIKFLPKREEKISPNSPSSSPSLSPPSDIIPTFALSEEFSKDKLSSFRVYAATQADLFPSDKDPFLKAESNLLEIPKLWSEYIARIDFPDKNKFLQQVVGNFNCRYNLWNEEFEQDCLKRPEYVRKTFFLPFLEKSSKSKVIREFEDYINNVVEAIRESQPFHDQYGIENIYIINLLSRTTDNLHKIGVANIINPIVQMIKIALVRYKTPFSSNIKNLEHTDPEQSYIQILLANCFQILLNCLAFHGNWRKSKHTKIKEIVEVIRESKKEASKQGAILVIKGYLDHLNTISNTNGPLSGSQEEFQLLLLNVMGAFLSRSTSIKNTFSQTGLLEVLFNWLGWPEKLISDPLITAANNPKLRDEFRLQLLCLNVIQESIGPNHQTVERITSIGGWDIILDTIMWITEIFSINPYLACAKLISAGDVKKESVSSWSSASIPNSNSPMPRKRNPIEGNFSGFKPIERIPTQELVQPNTKELKQIFEILFSMCEKVDSEESDEFSFKIVLNVNRYVIKMISDIFRCDVKSTPNNTRVRAKLKNEYPELQITVLHFTRDLLSIHPESISFCSRFGIWDTLFTDYFFYSGLQSDISLLKDDFNQTRHQCFQSIKIRVLKFIQFAASMDDHDNIEECRKLFELLNTYHSRADIVSNVIDSFINIVKNNLRATQNSIIRLNSISIFCMIISEYLFIFRQMNIKPKDLPNDIVSNIISKMMRLLNNLLLRNEDLVYFFIKETRLVNIIFSLLYDPLLREFSFPLVINLMSVKVESKRSEEDISELIKFYNIYFATLKKIQNSALITNFELQLLLLEGIRSVIKKSPTTRKLFKESKAFSNIINCITSENRLDRKPDLCIESLKCFTSLMTDSRKNKLYFKDNIEYSKLKTILLDTLNNDSENKLRDEIVNILFDLLVDGDFDINAKYEIQNSDAIPLIFDLFPALSLSQREEIITVFTNIIGKSPLNQSLCSSKYLIFFLLEMLTGINRHGDLMGKVISLIETLGSVSITVKELKRKFLLLTSEPGNFRPSIQNRLLKSLQFMALSSSMGPASFFDFDGNTSSLIIPPLEKWPHSHGYTFCLWFRVESFMLDLKEDQKKQPHLVSFLDESDLGIEIYFIPGQYNAKLEVSIKLGTGKNSIYTFNDTSFNDRRWYYLAITHSSHRNLPFRIHNNENEIKVYINGEFVERQLAKYPQFPGILNNVRIGAYCKGGSKIRKGGETHHFYGQLGPILIFDDHLTQAQVKLVYQSCIDHLINTAGTSCFGELESKIFLYYNANARAGKYFLDLSPEKNREKRLDAKLTGKLHSSVIRDVKDIIHCLGGIKVLFPIFAQLDQPLAPASVNDPIDYTIDKHILQQALALLGDMLNKSETNQREMIRSQGFSVISYLIQRLSPEHLTSETVVTLEDFASKIKNGVIPIMDEFLVHAVFNWNIWINAPTSAQKDLVILLHNYIKSNTEYMRKIIGIQKLLDVLSFYYWYEAKGLPGFLPGLQPVYHPITNKLQGQRPNDNDICSLRKSIFNSIQYIISYGVIEAEVQAIVRATVECQDRRQLLELLTFIHDALQDNIPNFAEFLYNFTSTTLFVLMLNNDDEQIRIINILIIGLLYRNPILNLKDKRKDIEFPAIGRILSSYPFTLKIYKAVFSLITSTCINNSVIIDDVVTIDEIRVLPIIFKLLMNCELLIRQKALQDIYLLLSNSSSNRDVILKFEGWSILLFSVLGASSCEEPKAVLEIIYNICKVLMLHSFSTEKLAHKTIQEIITGIMVLSSKNVVDHVEVIRNIFMKILHLLNSQLRSKPSVPGVQEIRRNTVNTSGSQQKEKIDSSLLIPNLIYFCTILEEFLFYTPSSSVFLSNRTVSTSMVTHIENNEWMDIELARLFLDTVFGAKLLDNTNAALIEQVYKDAPKNSVLRSGGIQRIVLRIALYVIMEGDVKACVENIPRIRSLLDRDLVNSKVEVSSRLSYALSCLLLLNHRIVNERPDEIGKSKAIVPVTKDLLRACVSVLPPGTEAKQLQYLSETSTIKEFSSSFSSQQWVDNILVWARTVYSNMESEDKGFITTIDKKRTKLVNSVLNFMQREQKNEGMSEKKMATEFQLINERILQPEIERKKNEFLSMENDLRQQQRNWRHIYRSLTNERAPWGTTESNVYWKLNKTENFSRMRLKLKRNYNFDPHSDAARESIETPQELESTDRDDKNLLNQLKSLNLGHLNREEIIDESLELNVTDEVDIISNQEKLLYSTSCDLITPLKVTSGKLEITVAGLFFKEEGESTNPKEVKIALDKIFEVHLRRYVLRQSAIEIFLTDRSNYFMNFSKRERYKVYNKIIQLNPPNLTYHETGLPEQILRRSDMTRKWQLRLVSNFDYLMYLNTIAGRSYNDITQYPVFPWVLSNYESETIDLNDPSNYRDLSKPIGALNPKRLEMFKARYENFLDPDIPQFHYGSHYSSSGIVLYYLIRAEPFTSQFLKLQGGKFDHADRMFDTIPKCWYNVMNASSDVKELIPEFFYFPDFLVNSNKFNLGCKQGGVPMGDVGLPPWANTPEQFIHINRCALESDYVSSHLHEWIDLIFGFKQRGRDAIEAFNVFYYLTYEGAVDIDSIQDEDQRKATESQIDNFGQTPAQLALRPHLPRNGLADSHQTILFRMANKATVKTYPITISTDALSFVCLPGYAFNSSTHINVIENDSVITVTENRFAGIHKFSSLPNSVTSFPFTFEIDNPAFGKKKIGAPFASEHSVSSQCFATSLDGKVIVSCGHWDYSIKCSWLDNSKAPQSLIKHKDIVTCLAMGCDGKTFVTGSKDTTVLVWEIVYQKGSPIKVEENPLHVLYGHNDEVTCVAVDVGLDVCVSGSNDGTCIVHDLRQGTYVRSIYHPNNLPIDLISISPIGEIVFFSRRDSVLYSYNVNGVFLSSIMISENIETMLISSNSEFLVTGSVEGQLCLRQLRSLKLLTKVPVNIKICSLSLSPDECFLFVGLGDGNLLILYVEEKVKSLVYSPI